MSFNFDLADSEEVDFRSFPLAPSVIEKLINAGFRNVEDFKGIKVLDLARECDIKPDVALMAINFANGKFDESDELAALENSASAQTTTAASSATLSKQSQGFKNFVNQEQKKLLEQVQGETALQLLAKTGNSKKIVTLCEQLDEQLKGGIHLGTLTELCGVPGIGKTQIGIQLAVNVQLPEEFDGLDGDVLYIDAEGSFFNERLTSITTGLIQHCQSYAAQQNDQKLIDIASKMNVEDFLKRIIYYRVLNYVELLALMAVIPSFVSQRPKLKLIIIDSITAHFRSDFEDFAHRSRLLQGVGAALKDVAKKGVAVVLMNQVTTKVERGNSYIAPALGDSWAHVCANRVMLYWKNGKRFAYIAKSTVGTGPEVQFDITPEGFRGVEQAENATERT